MLEGLKGLLDSKKAFAGGLLVICATVLVGIGKMSVEMWTDYTTWIFVTYASAETANGVMATWKGAGKPKKDPKKEDSDAPSS